MSNLAKVEAAVPEFQALVNLNCQDQNKAAAIVAQELEFLREVSISNQEILKCTPDSVVLAVKRAMKNNLTLDPQAGLVYVKTRNVNTGTKEQPQWVKVMETQETCNGIVSKLRMFGRILDIKRPEVKHDETGKVVSVAVEWLVPSTPQPRWERAEFGEYDFYRWKAASHKEKSRGQNDASTKDYSNPLYSSWKGGIDPEFARAKSIRHALKKLGANANEMYAKAIQQVEPIQIIESNANHAEVAEEVLVTSYEVINPNQL